MCVQGALTSNNENAGISLLPALYVFQVGVTFLSMPFPLDFVGGGVLNNDFPIFWILLLSFIQQMIAWLLYVLGALRGAETTEMNVVVFILQDMTI